MKTMYKKLLLLLLIIPVNLLAQSKLDGIVTDKNLGQPLPGVNVVVKGSTNGVSTDFDGKFSLTKLKSGDVIVFSYMGFKSYSLNYSGEQNLTITLEEESSNLEEVAVIGYGTVKKKDATGSIDVISSKDFNKGPVLSVDQLLVGKAPGVRITNAGGAPDSAPNIRIRGGSSISAQNNPLIVIDGVPIDVSNAAGSGNPLSFLNPNDIDSFTILKDASATAIYGSRASNGVIIITTKKGTTGAPQFNFSSSVSVGSARDRINMKNGSQFTDFVRQNYPESTYLLGVDDPLTTPVNSQTEDDPTTIQIEGRILSNTDWQDVIYRESVSTDNNFSVGANLFKKIPFRASVGHAKYEGLVRTNDFERVTAALKLTPVLFDNHLKIDLNAKGQFSEKNAIDEGGVFGSVIGLDPTKPVFGLTPNNLFGGYYNGLNSTLAKIGPDNPLAVLEQRRRPEVIRKLLANIELDYKMHFFPALRAVLNLGLETSESNIEEVFRGNAIQTYRNIGPGVFNPGTNFRERQTKVNQTMDSYLVYTKETSGLLKKFDIQGGYSYQNFLTDGNQVRFRYNDLTGLREEDIDKNNRYNRYVNQLNLQSFFGRSNIDLAGKYLFTLSFRADGSSLFQKDQRWGYFPAAAFAWKISNENFLKSSKFITDLKLRLGWGKTGQQDITDAVGYYPSTPLFGPAGANSQYLPGFNSYSAFAFDPDLTWERTTTYNVGLDFELFKNNLITGSFDVYKRETTDLLARVPVTPGTGLSNEFVSNVAATEGRGAETSLNIKPISNQNFTLEFNGNVAFNYNEITDLKGRKSVPADNSGIPGAGTGVRLANHAVGFQPGSAFVLEQIYDAAGKPIEGAFVDRDGIAGYTDADKVYKSLAPNWTFGFGTSVVYKNFDLNASFRGQAGGLVYNARAMQSGNIEQARPGVSGVLTNVLGSELLFQDNNDPRYFSDHFLEDASFIRCENISLGYKVNKAIKNATLRLYISANNLFIITNYSGQDPENFNSIDNNFYPRPQVYSFGLNLNF